MSEPETAPPPAPEPNPIGPLLAWRFDLGPDREDGVQVVFARSEARAMIYAGHQSGGGHRERTSVTHVPDFDKYATVAGGNPDTADFWEEGYTVSCSYCEHMIGTDPCDDCADNLSSDLDDDGEPVPGRTERTDDEIEAAVGHPLSRNGAVYCNERCLRLETEQAARRKLRKAEATAGLLAKFPFVKPLGASIGGVGGCQGRPEDGYHPPDRHRRRDEPLRKKTCFDVDDDNATVRFKVPGGELSETVSDGNAYHNSYCHRCGQVWIARGDYAAFECLAVTPDVVVTDGPRAVPMEFVE